MMKQTMAPQTKTIVTENEFEPSGAPGDVDCSSLELLATIVGLISTVAVAVVVVVVPVVGVVVGVDVAVVTSHALISRASKSLARVERVSATSWHRLAGFTTNPAPTHSTAAPSTAGRVV